MTIEGVPHTIGREGLASGAFTLARGGAVIARARRHSALRSRFEREHAVHRYELQKPSWWGRGYELLLDGQPVGSIRPRSPFTRRATIELPPDLPLSVQVFLAALVAFMWQREASAGG